MAKSALTIAELDAQAVLLGLHYDKEDHTFFKTSTLNSDFPLEEYDADTLELIPPEHGVRVWRERRTMVRAGTLGAKDNDHEKMPYDWQDDKDGASNSED